MSNRVALIDTYGWKGYYYYLLFPMDLWRPDTDEQLAYQETKLTELLPILGWLVPLLVLITGTTTSMGFFSLVTGASSPFSQAAISNPNPQKVTSSVTWSR